jgi:hypothetical protein
MGMHKREDWGPELSVRRVLAVIDFTDIATLRLRRAAEVAARDAAILEVAVVASAFEPWVAALVALAGGVVPLDADLDEPVERRIVRLIDEIAGDVSVRWHIVRGSTSRALRSLHPRHGDTLIL